MKSILLLNEVSVKSIGHDLVKALKIIDSFSHFEMELTENIRKLIIKLNEEGKNRYLDYPYSFHGLTILELDEIVWYIRRYCVPKNKFWNVGDLEINLQELDFKCSHNEKYKKNPCKYRLSSTGILERILADKNSLIRKQLIWKNRYYGERQKRKIKNVTVHSSFGKPPHFDYKDQIDEIDKYVKFSEGVIEYLKKKK